MGFPRNSEFLKIYTKGERQYILQNECNISKSLHEQYLKNQNQEQIRSYIRPLKKLKVLVRSHGGLSAGSD